MKEVPAINKKILERIFKYLEQVALLSDVNQMNASNLAIIFSPVLLIPEGADIQKIIEDGELTKIVVQYLITHYSLIFGVSETQPSQSQTQTETQIVPPSPKPLPHSELTKVVSTDSFDDLDDIGVSVAELGDYLTEGNFLGVENYLESMENEKREEVSNEILDKLLETLKKKGVEIPVDDKSSRRRYSIKTKKLNDELWFSGLIHCMIDGKAPIVDDFLSKIEDPELRESTRKRLDTIYAEFVKKNQIRRRTVVGQSPFQDQKIEKKAVKSESDSEESEEDSESASPMPVQKTPSNGFDFLKKMGNESKK